MVWTRTDSSTLLIKIGVQCAGER